MSTFIVEHHDVLDPESKTTTRRTFLRLVAAGTTLAAAGCSSSGGSSPAAFGDVPAGNVSALAVGTINVVPNAVAAVARDAQGVYAMTLTCTHEACDMVTQGTVVASGITCHCHGSVFDINGNVVNGPAQSPLQHFAVSIDGAGNITVHGGTNVSSSTRTAVA